MLPRTRARLATAHRWLALLMAPVFVAILLSGALLAFSPILGKPGEASSGGRLDPARLVGLLQRVDPRGKAPYLFLTPDEGTVGVIQPETGEAKYFSTSTGLAVPEPRQPSPDVFDIALRIHKDLWFGLGGLVGFGTFAMLVLVLLGPLLARPARRPSTPLGRHIWLGWILWPLLALLPVSVVLMKLHPPVVTSRSGAPMPLARAVDMAARTVDLSRLRAVQALPGGSAMLFIASATGGPSRFVVHPDGLHPFESTVSTLGRALHAGTWAGPWSGVINLISTLLLLLMMGLGLASWSRSLRGTRAGERPASRPSAQREPEPAHR